MANRAAAGSASAAPGIGDGPTGTLDGHLASISNALAKATAELVQAQAVHLHDTAQDERGKLEKALHTEQETSSALRKDLSIATSRIEELEAELEREKAARIEHTSALEAKTKRASDIQSGLQAELDEAEAEVRELTSLVSRLELEKMTLSGRVRELEDHTASQADQLYAAGVEVPSTPEVIRQAAPSSRVEMADIPSRPSSGVQSQPAAPTESTPAPSSTGSKPTGTAVFEEVNRRLTAELVEQVGGIFEFDVKKPDGSMDYWTLDMLHGSGAIYYGKPTDGCTADTTMSMTEETLRRWLSQETDPVTALMAGELSVSGDYQVAQKLAVLQPVVRAATGLQQPATPRGSEFQKQRAERLRMAAQRAAGGRPSLLDRLGMLSRSASEQEMNFVHVKRTLTAEYSEAEFAKHEGGVKAFLKMYHAAIDKARDGQLQTFKKQMEGIFQASGGQSIDFESLRDRLVVEFGEQYCDNNETAIRDFIKRRCQPKVSDSADASGAASPTGGGDGVSPEVVLGEVNRRLTAEHVEKVGGVFRFDIAAGKHKQIVKQWTLDVKHGSGKVYPGPPHDGIHPDATLTMSETILSKWLNQKIEPVYAYMTGQLKMVGDQKIVIKLNALKPLFKEACEAAAQPVSQADSEARAAEEAEWAQYQAEERRRAEEFAKVLEQEAAERRARKEEEQRLARLRAIAEAEAFAKAASEDLCWDITTDSEREKAAKDEAQRKDLEERARIEAQKQKVEDAARRAQQVRAALDLDMDSSAQGKDLFNGGSDRSGTSTPQASGGKGKLDLDDLFASVEEETENEKREREERERAARAELEALEEARRQEEEKLEKLKAERQAKLQADWERIHEDTKAKAEALAIQRKEEAVLRAQTRKAKAEMNSLFGFTVEPVSIFDEEEDLQESPVKARTRGQKNPSTPAKTKTISSTDIFGVESDEDEANLSLARAQHRKLGKNDVPRQPKLKPKPTPKKEKEAVDLEAERALAEKQAKEEELRLQQKEAAVAAEKAAAKAAKEARRKKKLKGYDGKNPNDIFGDEAAEDDRFIF
eukprot:m.137759 g.137759  ORF g.137759 m.137759 type:complete len:1047 (+) comp11469_c0_seq2:119-3259(+)